MQDADVGPSNPPPAAGLEAHVDPALLSGASRERIRCLSDLSGACPVYEGAFWVHKDACWVYERACWVYEGVCWVSAACQLCVRCCRVHAECS